ncbi:MAG TPA: hypothetical protein VF215_02155, partial [Thermoanaerobaculia bacterium]
KKSKLSDPADLKTLAQFNLLGDPSIHPVAAKAIAKPSSKKGKGLVAAAASATMQLDAGHLERREALRESAPAAAAESHSVAETAPDADAASRAREVVAQMGLNPGSVKTFALDAPQAMPKGAFGLVASADTSARIHAVTVGDEGETRAPRTPPGFSVAIVREEPDGTMNLVRRLYAK